MTTKKADNKAERNANKTALKGFQRAKVTKLFEAMSESRTAEDAQNETRSTKAHELCVLAHDFFNKNDNVPLDTVVQGWRENMGLIIMQLAVAGNQFAELIEAKDNKPARAKLTGYGNNVASIAKGIIEHEIVPEPTFGECRTAVEEARRAVRRASDPDGAALEDAKAECDDQWKELRKAVFDKGHITLVQALNELLSEAHETIMAKPEAQEAENDDDIEAEKGEDTDQPDQQEAA